MIIRNSGSIFRFFLIFSMNFAWIANAFGFIGSKKELFSVKKVLKSINFSKSARKEAHNEDYAGNKTMPAYSHQADFVVKTTPIVIGSVTLPNIFNHQAKAIKRQMLLPYHGFV